MQTPFASYTWHTVGGWVCYLVPKYARPKRDKELRVRGRRDCNFIEANSHTHFRRHLTHLQVTDVERPSDRDHERLRLRGLKHPSLVSHDIIEALDLHHLLARSQSVEPSPLQPELDYTVGAMLKNRGRENSSDGNGGKNLSMQNLVLILLFQGGTVVTHF